MSQYLGDISAYALAVSQGYTGTEEEYAELMASYATVGQTAVTAAQTATTKASEAATSATTATNKATEATTAATTATNKAAEAQADADAAALDASQALSAASTATTKASEATTAAATATSAATTATTAKDDAVSAKTAAQTAQTGAETAAASVEASAEQIATNAEDISQLKSEFTVLTSDGVVPSAEQLLSDKGVTDSVPYHFRKTGGNGADRLYDQIVGGTVCWNQLCNGSSVTVTSGHKYVSKVSTTWTVGASTDSAITGLTSGSDMIIDLTQMFGTTIADYVYGLETANAGAGVAWLKSHFPRIFNAGYIPYNAGELVSVQASAHKMTGFNQWDEEWERANINWSTNVLTPDPTGGRLASKNYIPVIPGSTYYINTNRNETFMAGYVDSDGNGGTVITINVISKEFTIPSNIHYIKFGVTTSSYGTTYKNDICINLSDPAKNGTYEPYKAHSYPLDDSLTLRGLFKLDANNNLYTDGDTYDTDGTVTRKYGIMVIDGVNYKFSGVWGATDNGYSVYCTVSDWKTNRMVANAVSDKFTHSSEQYASMPLMTFVGGSGALGTMSFILPSTVTSLAEANAWASQNPITVVYELATPTTEEAEPYQHLQQCNPIGTEEYVSTGIVPVGHNSFYPENLRAKVEQLPWNFANLIAPTESTFTASRNYTTGELFIVDNVLYKATSNIANGGTITPNTNCTATTLAEIISALA